MSQKIWLTWNQTTYPIAWNANPYTWEEVAVVIEVGQYAGGWMEPPRWPKGPSGPDPLEQLKDSLPKEKLEFFIKVVCKVNDLNYEKRKDRKTKPVVTVREINRTFQKMAPMVKVSFAEKDI